MINIICPHCNKETPDDRPFCIECGDPIDEVLRKQLAKEAQARVKELKKQEVQRLQKQREQEAAQRAAAAAKAAAEKKAAEEKKAQEAARVAATAASAANNVKPASTTQTQHRLEIDRLERERQDEERRIAADKGAKKRKITIAIVASIIAFVILLKTVIIPKQKDNEAVSNSGQEIVDSFYDLNIGDVYKFGSYEQDNNTANGIEDIEWIVLAKEENRVLVISKYALDCQPYNTSFTSVTWETCSLRKWLNGTFLNAAFSESERAMIPTMTVSADNNPSYSTSPGNSTTDQVFLLSITEVNKYFSSDSARQCQGTAYCYAQGAYKADNGNCWWWLRSPGCNSDLAAYVLYDGSVDDLGSSVSSDLSAVRPALWINLGA